MWHVQATTQTGKGFLGVFNSSKVGHGHPCIDCKHFLTKCKWYFKISVWRYRGSNPGPFTCKANALPLRYIPYWHCESPYLRKVKLRQKLLHAFTSLSAFYRLILHLPATHASRQVQMDENTFNSFLKRPKLYLLSSNTIIRY